MRTLVEELGRHPVHRMAAALAFFALFGLPALAVVLLVVGGAVFGDDAARSGLLQEVERQMGPEARATLGAVLDSTPRPGEGRLATQVLAAAVLLVGATATFHELQGMLNAVWDAPRRRGWWRVLFLVVKRLLSFAMLVASALVVVAQLGLSAMLTAFPDGLARVLPSGVVPFVRGGLEIAVSLALMSVHFLVLFLWLPDAKVPWRSALLGALSTAALFLAGKRLLVLYLEHANLATAFGAAGSLVVTLVWFYAAAYAVLAGAVLSRAHARWRADLASPPSA